MELNQPTAIFCDFFWGVAAGSYYYDHPNFQIQESWDFSVLISILPEKQGVSKLLG